jgi:hypothetical protein
VGTSAAAGDLYKVGVWFEFKDDNASMASATSATAQRFTTTPNSTYKTGPLSLELSTPIQ